MKMKITLKNLPFKKKTYEVKQSVKNMRKTYALQLAFAQNTDNEGKSDDEIVAGILDSFDTAIEYITNMLKLSDAQAEKLEDDLDTTQLFNIANSIAMQLMGVNPDDLKTDEPSKE